MSYIVDFERIGRNHNVHSLKVYHGWRFTGTPWCPPRQGDTTHTAPACQQAYVARRLHGKRSQGGWSMLRIAQHYGVSVYRVRRWVKVFPREPLSDSRDTGEKP